MNHPPPRPDPGSTPSPSPLLRSLLQAAREDAPSRVELAEVAEGLPLRSARPRGGLRRLSRAPAAAVCAMLALAAAVVLVKRPAPRPPETTLPARASADWPAPVSTAPEPPAVATAEPAPPSDPAPARAAAASRSAVHRPSVRVLSTASVEAPAAGSAVPAPPASVEPSAAGAGASKSESDLLERAAIVLDRNPAEALRLTDDHLAGFPAGELREEREVIAVQALLQLGRADEARARGARFLQQYPRSSRRALMEAMIAR